MDLKGNVELKSLYIKVSFPFEFNWLLEFGRTRQVETIATFQNFIPTIIRQYQLKLGMTYKFSIATLKREHGMNVCCENKYLCRDNHIREISLKKAKAKSRQRVKT